MRKVLFLRWNCYAQEFAERAFIRLGIEPHLYYFEAAYDPTVIDPSQAEGLVQTILSDSYEFVFSMNYFPAAAIVCKACKMKYVSWVYDAARPEMYSDTIFYSNNYIFIFDKMIYQDFLKRGANAFYLPLAADVDYYDSFISSKEQIEKYSSEISFIGDLYKDIYIRFPGFEGLATYTKGYLDGLIQAQKRVYGYNFLEDALPPDILDQMRKVQKIKCMPDGFETPEWLYTNLYLYRKLAEQERYDILSMLSDHHPMKLYTYQDTPQFPKIKNMGAADYYKEVPYIIKNSKINLNTTFRAIFSGIPLRAFDIWGCGGFLLTNFQADFLQYFIPGEDFVYYENYEDLENKVQYYLEHEDKREAIAKTAYEKVKEKHLYNHRIAEILSKVCN